MVHDIIQPKNVDIFRNDKISLNKIDRYDKILFGPGPSLPKDAGMMPKILESYFKSKSILGVCLGHQAIAEQFKANLFNMEDVLHGIQTQINVLNDDYLFESIPKTIKVARYHSWAVNPQSLNDSLIVTAKDVDGTIMGISHKIYDVKGLQFHPESILTEFGNRIIENWLKN